MEQNAFENSLIQKKKRKRRRTVILVVVLLLLVLAGGAFLMRLLSQNTETSAGVRTYQVAQVLEGEISTNVSGSGQLTAKELEAFAAEADATVESVLVQPGDTVKAGDALMTLSSDSIQEQLDALKDELDTLKTTMARTTQIRSNRYFSAPRAGIVKDLQVGAGDNMEDAAYLCLLSTDGRMKLTIETDASLRPYDDVRVTVADTVLDGYVYSVSDHAATVIIKDNQFLIGTEASVSATDGTVLGSGALALNEYITVAPEYGRILTCYIQEGTKLSKGEAMFYMDYDAPNTTYIANKETEADLLRQIAEKEAALSLTAPFDGLITSVSVQNGDEVASGAALVTVLGFSGYTMSVSVDELDIYQIAIGQGASITFDSVEGTYQGLVDNISYEGSSGGNVTTFPVTVDIDYQAGTFPGSSASAEIIVETSGQTLLVPVDAVQYESGNAFLYLAPDGAAFGETYIDGVLDLSALDKVSVTTGMSDGSYIAVSGNLTTETLFLLPKLTTTNSYSASANSDTSSTFTMNGMGNMGGMQMPSGVDPGERRFDSGSGRRSDSGATQPGGNG